MRRPDPYLTRARELAMNAGLDPDARVGPGRGMPAWCAYRQAARDEHVADEQRALADSIDAIYPAAQPEEYVHAPLASVGLHESSTVEQMNNCMKVGNVVAGALCADAHLGYAQPVGGAIAYEGQISISGVGFDIACGNMAVRLDLSYPVIADAAHYLIQEVAKTISFGVGRTNDERVEHALFDNDELWKAADREDFKAKAQSQLGTVGSGNHYVDLFRDEHDMVWIGVHFGSRGLGHTSATKYLKAAGGKDGINVAPAVVDTTSEIGVRYLAAMELAGQYAYAGREWVVERVRKIVAPDSHVMESIHNHHNFAWEEEYKGRRVWVVRKGCTPAFPGQLGFVGGSMGDDAVILEGAWPTGLAEDLLFSTVHGAGRTFGRKEAIRRFTRAQMEEWLTARGVSLVGGAVDESPMAYRRLPEVLRAQGNTIKIRHTLTPFAVAMAGEGEFDPYKG